MSNAQVRTTDFLEPGPKTSEDQSKEISFDRQNTQNRPPLIQIDPLLELPPHDHPTHSSNEVWTDIPIPRTLPLKVIERCRMVIRTSDEVLEISADAVQSRSTSLLYMDNFERSWQHCEKLLRERVLRGEDVALTQALAEVSSAYQDLWEILRTGTERESLLTTTMYSSMKQQARLVELLKPFAASGENDVAEPMSSVSEEPSSYLSAESKPLLEQYYQARSELMRIEEEISILRSGLSSPPASISDNDQIVAINVVGVQQPTYGRMAELEHRRQLAEQAAADLWDACYAAGIDMDSAMIRPSTSHSDRNDEHATSAVPGTLRAAAPTDAPSKENTSSLLQAYSSFSPRSIPGPIVSAEPDTTRIRDRIQGWIGSLSSVGDDPAWRERLAALQIWRENWQWQKNVAKQPEFQFHSSRRSEGWIDVELVDGESARKSLLSHNLQGEYTGRSHIEERRRRHSDPWVLIGRRDNESAPTISSLREQDHLDHG